MNRLTSFLALSAIVVAGAFAGTAAEASAANVNVNLKVHNGDGGSASMIRSTTSANISGLISPAAAISPGNDDPASGFAVFSAAAPRNIGDFVQGSVVYVNFGNQNNNKCTFNVQVTRLGFASYKLHFWISESGTNCSVPGDVTNSDGQFTSSTYIPTWST